MVSHCLAVGMSYTTLASLTELRMMTPGISGSPETAGYDLTRMKTISSVTGATITYTTDGTNPTASSQAFTAPHTVDQPVTFKATDVSREEADKRRQWLAGARAR